MKLGFYYHIPVRKDHECLLTDSCLGCFLDAIAANVDELILLMHGADELNSDMDYVLRATNIRFVSLGKKPHAVSRTFLGNRLVEPIKEELRNCGLFLVRAPTHLFGAWSKACRQVETLFVPLLVGDYRAGNANLNFPFPKKQLVQGLNWLVDARERACLRGKTVLVNSCVLSAKYKSVAAKIHEVRTTTLSENSFFSRDDTCGGSINLLYAGRFEWQKGLQELIDAFCKLVVDRRVDARLHFAGWQDSRGPSIEEAIMRQAKEHGIRDRVTFHGKKKVGPDLDTLYRLADICVLPSYAEGFPRTIWEAMANSLPVVAARVGSIPFYLKDRQHAILIEPQSSEAIVSGIMRVVQDDILRRKLIREGRELAQGNTLEIQAASLINILKEEIH